MASGYALPRANGDVKGNGHQHSHYHGHAHSHSYSAVHLSPDGAGSITNGLLPFRGPAIRKAVSTNNLYPHPETSPLSPPAYEKPYDLPAFAQNTAAYTGNTRTQSHIRALSASPMKSTRPRGPSDLGRPGEARGVAYTPSLNTTSAASTTWFSLPEALTALLIPLPYMLASVVYSSTSGETLEGGFPPLPARARIQHGLDGQDLHLVIRRFSGDSGIIETGVLTAGTLLLVGIVSKINMSGRPLDRRKESSTESTAKKRVLTLASAQSMALRVLSVGLPFYASMQIGGLRVGLVFLTAIATGLVDTDVRSRGSLLEWKHIISTRTATCSMIATCVLSDFAGLTFHAPLLDQAVGYLALALSVFALPPPLAQIIGNHATPSKSDHSRKGRMESSPLNRSEHDVIQAIVAGVVLCLFLIAAEMLPLNTPSFSLTAILFSAICIAAMTASALFSEPESLRSQDKAGVGLGCLLSASCAFAFSPSLWPGTICNGGLSALAFLGVLFDSSGEQHHDDHEHTHNLQTHRSQYHLSGKDEKHSFLTQIILERTRRGSLVHGIVSDKDSRRIAYFTILNFGFMFVQGVYGYLSGSLGLLSDTVHMFFDCLGLVVGLGAAVASKWPTSPEKPYGWSKLNTLAGFGNGVFLMLVSVEFVWEAIEGIVEERKLRHVEELLVVSTLGLLVNLVGLFAFGHAHAGHDHGHAHEVHPHDHHHPSSGSHTHANGHLHESLKREHSHSPSPRPAPSHDHHNENMHGIYLHVAADAGGSLAVIASTALTLWKPWYLWDPLATIIIAVLIFAAAVPLVTSSGQKLLLVVPDELEHSIKVTLQELGELRGVLGYAVPRFWVDDREPPAEDEHHHHAHHDHADGHDHHDSVAPMAKIKVQGVIHVIAAHTADLEDVRARVDGFVRERGMDLVIHVEREVDGACWCGGLQQQPSQQQ